MKSDGERVPFGDLNKNITNLKALTDHLGGGSRVGSFDPY
jgi:hypothetical protein